MLRDVFLSISSIQRQGGFELGLKGSGAWTGSCLRATGKGKLVLGTGPTKAGIPCSLVECLLRVGAFSIRVVETKLYLNIFFSST